MIINTLVAQKYEDTQIFRWICEESQEFNIDLSHFWVELRLDLRSAYEQIFMKIGANL